MSLDETPRVEETLQQLRDEAPNQQVESLLGVVEQLNIRLERLEAIADPDLDAPLQGSYDTYDETILAILSENDTEMVALGDFVRLYRRHTQLQQKSTIKERVKAITDIGPFEWVDNGKWRFLGFPDTDG